jgi:hypothetical protein
VTTETLTLTHITADDAGTYFVRVTDLCESEDSAAGLLTVLNAPCQDPFADADGNGVVDLNDYGAWQRCYTGPDGPVDLTLCACFDRNLDGDVDDGQDSGADDSDLDAFLDCAAGHPITADPACDGVGGSFTEDFDVDHTANWTVNVVPSSQCFAEFFFDYASVGIPSAPHSTGGTTRGLRLRANVSGNVASGISVSPTGQSFTGNYSVRFDAWLNYNGPVNGGGVGSTQFTTWGVNTSGNVVNWVTGQDGIFLAVDGDGGTNFDYRVYDPGHTTSYPDGSSVYAAATNTPTWTTRNAGHPYYAQYFGGSVENNAAPPAMISLFPAADLTGVADSGAAGFRWRDVEIVRNGQYVVFYMDGRLIATVDSTASGTLGGSNIFFGQSDLESVSSADPTAPDLLFGLIDNIRVTSE